MVKRVYFGNWLRDYSQAVDVGTLKGIQSGTIRILVWVLSFLSFGYATGEFEVTEERLGVYRPEEHIDNPKDYADNVDARKYDERLRPPVQPMELQIDPETGMKNYIANEQLGIATSAGYVKHSFSRSIHFGRVYTSGGSGIRGKEADLCEALRCLGQGLHCLEDFGAHTNYTELALREMGFTGVFPHTGTATEVVLHGHRVFPLVTGTFGAVDFLHSVLGEATDHFAQTEVEQMDIALKEAQGQSQASDIKQRGFGQSEQLSAMTHLLSQVPGTSGLCQQAATLQAQSDAQQNYLSGRRGAPIDASVSMTPPPPYNHSHGAMPPADFPAVSGNVFAPPPGTVGGPPGPSIPGMSPDFDPMKTAAQIYPILEFRDKVVRIVSATIEKIPGLEALVEKITEKLTLFILSLLAPFIRPIINAVSVQLKAGSSSVVNASGNHQYEPWTDPHCSDPTHSMLSKDHFSNTLNEPAGKVASCILQYVAPRVLYAWEHPDVPVEQVFNDIIRVFHHPAIRDPHCELHQNMFNIVQRWAHSQPSQSNQLNDLLGSESVRNGKNHRLSAEEENNIGGALGAAGIHAPHTHTTHSGASWEHLTGQDSSSGVGREIQESSSAADNIVVAYPSTETTFDNRRPSPSPNPVYQQAPYGHPSYLPTTSQQEQPAYGYQAPQHESYSHPGLQPQQAGYGYNQMPYGYDANAPPPQQPPYGGAS